MSTRSTRVPLGRTPQAARGVCKVLFSVLLWCAVAIPHAFASCPPTSPGPGYETGEARFVLSKSIYPANTDLDLAVRKEFGPTAKIVEWNDLKRVLSNQRNITNFINSVGLLRQPDNYGCRNYFVRFNGKLSTGKYRYFIARHDGVRPDDWSSLDNIGGNQIDLGRWDHPSQALVQLPPEPLIATLPSGDQKPALVQRVRPSTERRIALVIGNSNYAAAAALENPTSDATAVTAAFKALGFKGVTTLIDADHAALLSALSKFAEEASGADWAVIYYAGHGIEVGGKNYIIPVDATLKTDKQVAFQAVALDQLMEAAGGATGLRLVLLDACRDNPFAHSMKVTSATRSVGRGLARVEPTVGTLVVYAARDGQVASDGTSGNSPFTKALLEAVSVPNVEISLVFRRIRDKVLEATANEQEPFVYGSLPSKEFYFSQAE
jgi:hypothetical protein